MRGLQGWVPVVEGQERRGSAVHVAELALGLEAWGLSTTPRELPCVGSWSSAIRLLVFGSPLETKVSLGSSPSPYDTVSCPQPCMSTLGHISHIRIHPYVMTTHLSFILRSLGSLTCCVATLPDRALWSCALLTLTGRARSGTAACISTESTSFLAPSIPDSTHRQAVAISRAGCP